MLFRKNIDPRCAYCAKGSRINDEQVVCVMLRTKILADKGCQRHRKACNRQKRKSLNL